MKGFWKIILGLLALRWLTGFGTDPKNPERGCGCLIILAIVFFPIVMLWKILKWIFGSKK